MRVRVEATRDEATTHALGAVRQLAERLFAISRDTRLQQVAKAVWRAELGDAAAALTKSDRPAHHYVEAFGLRIGVENPVGSVRTRTNERTGAKGQTVMKFPYGRVEGTIDRDGDGYDVFLGPDPTASWVWIVHQARPDRGDVMADGAALYDEDKAFLGFTDAPSAVAAFHAHYDDPAFFGSMTQMSVADFVAKMHALAPKVVDGLSESPSHAQEPVMTPVEEAMPRFTVKGLDVMFTGDNPRGMGNRAVVTGSSGPNIAEGAPVAYRNPVDTSDPGGLAASMRELARERFEANDQAIRRDVEIYNMHGASLPPKAIPDVDRTQMIEQARADMAAVRTFVQDMADRRSDFIQNAHPERLLPRDERYTVGNAGDAE